MDRSKTESTVTMHPLLSAELSRAIRWCYWMPIPVGELGDNSGRPSLKCANSTTLHAADAECRLQCSPPDSWPICAISAARRAGVLISDVTIAVVMNGACARSRALSMRAPVHEASSSGIHGDVGSSWLRNAHKEKPLAGAREASRFGALSGPSGSERIGIGKPFTGACAQPRRPTPIGCPCRWANSAPPPLHSAGMHRCPGSYCAAGHGWRTSNSGSGGPH